MHFFRIKIKRRSTRTTDEIDSTAKSGKQRSHVPSTVIQQPRFKNSIWKLLPFAQTVSKEKC